MVSFALTLDLFFTGTSHSNLPFVQLEIRDGVDRGYRGRYARYEAFRRLLGQMPKRRLQALERAQRRTGLACFSPGRIVVRFRDAPGDHGFGASSRLVDNGDGPVDLVTLSAEHAIAGVMDLDGSMVHEMVHCIMRQRMGERAYRALPRWIREGAAVWAARQLPERARNVIAGAFLAHRDPGDVLGSLLAPGGALDEDKYLAWALVFAYLESDYGKGAVRYLLNQIVDGTPPGLAFVQTTGTTLEALDERRLAYSHMYLERSVLESGLFEFQVARDLHRAGATTDAIRVLAGLVQRRPDSLLQANALFWIGRWSYDLGHYPQAALAYIIVITNFPGNHGVRADSRTELARCLRRMSPEELQSVEQVLADGS